MSPSTFWIIDITASTVRVSLASELGGHSQVIGQGATVIWDEPDVASILSAVDQSLSLTATNAQISESDEPTNAAFILPPQWLDSDSKIVPTRLKIIESICKELKLKPMGYVPNDEAIIEQATTSGDLPPSFVLLHLEKNTFSISLAYLGKIQGRLSHSFADQFDASLVESALIELNSAATLPPQIIVYGNVTDEIYQNLKNYTWIGKRNIETFLHFPDIKLYSLAELTQIYSQFISTQLSVPIAFNPPQDQSVPEPLAEVITTDVATPIYEDTTPEELGFNEIINSPLPPPDLLPPPVIIEPSIVEEEIPPSPVKITSPKFSVSFPKINFSKPKISLSFLLIPIAISPLLILIPFYFSRASITVFVTPYTFDRQVNITLDANATEVNPTTNTIPVTKNSFDITASDTISTTGEKVVGEKARGDITIFNKSDKVVNLPKGSVLTDASGRKFELVSATSIASSSSNLDQGVITLGQTKTSIVAQDIGPEYNLSQSAILSLKDYSSNILIVKIKDNLAGGSKEQVKAVSSEDRKNLESRLTQSLTSSSQQNLSQKISAIPGAIKETIQIKKNHLEYDREVGEEATSLTATSQSTITVLSFKSDYKKQIINSFFGQDPNYQQSDVNPDDFNLKITITKSTPNQSSGQLAITGQALPKISVDDIKTKIAGKSWSSAAAYLKKDITRVYNYNVQTNYDFIKNLNPVPFLKNHIDITIKTQ